jgi:hypothetical protein
LQRGLQHSLNSIETWCNFWNIKINEDKIAPFIYLTDRQAEVHLTFNGINYIKHPGVIFNKRIAWRLNTEMIETKDSRSFIRLYSLFRSERQSANIKLTLHKALISSVMTHACRAWEFTAETRTLRVQNLQNKVHRTIGKFPRCTPACELHMA